MKIKKDKKRFRNLLKVGYFFIFNLVFVTPVFAQGLVQCGRGNDVNQRCTLCDLIVGLNNILNWGKNVMVYVALTGIFVSGIMYIISAGNQKLMDQAKEYIVQIVTGLAIVLGAWLFIETVMHVLSTNSDLGVGATGWSTFECKNSPTTTSSSSTSSSSSSTSSTTSSSSSSSSFPTSESSTTGDEQGTRDKLSEAGVNINRANACSGGATTGCTSVGGFQDATTEGIIDLKNSCGDNCNVTITGGSEEHASGTYSHGNGYKADIGFSDNLDSYIENNYTKTTSAFGGFDTYVDSKGNQYVKETSNPPHWDVCYQCK